MAEAWPVERVETLERHVRKVQRIRADIEAGYRNFVRDDDLDYARGDLWRLLLEWFGPDPGTAD